MVKNEKRITREELDQLYPKDSAEEDVPKLGTQCQHCSYCITGIREHVCCEQCGRRGDRPVEKYFHHGWRCKRVVFATKMVEQMPLTHREQNEIQQHGKGKSPVWKADDQRKAEDDLRSELTELRTKSEDPKPPLQWKRTLQSFVDEGIRMQPKGKGESSNEAPPTQHHPKKKPPGYWQATGPKGPMFECAAKQSQWEVALKVRQEYHDAKGKGRYYVGRQEDNAPVRLVPRREIKVRRLIPREVAGTQKDVEVLQNRDEVPEMIDTKANEIANRGLDNILDFIDKMEWTDEDPSDYLEACMQIPNGCHLPAGMVAAMTNHNKTGEAKVKHENLYLLGVVVDMDRHPIRTVHKLVTAGGHNSPEYCKGELMALDPCDGTRIKREDDTTEWHISYLAWNFFMELQDAFPPMIHLFTGISIEEEHYYVWLAKPQDALVEEVSDGESEGETVFGPDEADANEHGKGGKTKGK